jgi:hypothetical protein
MKNDCWYNRKYTADARIKISEDEPAAKKEKSHRQSENHSLH